MMPDFPIIDAHVHLWNPREVRMTWLDKLPALNRPFGLEDYTEATQGVQVRGFVYLEVDINPAYTIVEAQRIRALSEQDERILGIVAFAPIEDGECVRSYLDVLTGLGPKIKGIRRLTQALPDPEFCLTPGFIKGAQILAEYGLSCDLGITHRQLGPSTELVRRCPDTRFIIDHIAKPDIAANEMEPWRQQMAEMASLPNVICKISGVATAADWEHWTLDDVAPYVRHVFDVFGEDRVAFGSDWPVATQATTYKRWVDTVDQLTADWSRTAKQKLWHDNAERFYGLSGG